MFSVVLRPHAEIRMAQRGIRIEQIRNVLNYGRRKHIRKATVYFLGRKELRYFRQNNPALELSLRDSQNIHVVLRNNSVLTVYRNACPNLKEHAWFG